MLRDRLRRDGGLEQGESVRTVLAVGKRIRLVEGGPVHVVVRVNLCAAYVKNTEREHRVVRDKRTGEVQAEFDAPVGGLIAISPTAFVEEVESSDVPHNATGPSTGVLTGVVPSLCGNRGNFDAEEDACSDFEAEA
jgi:hypothetical protein